MTEEELVGKLMGAIASLQNTVAQQTAQINKLATEVMQLRAIVNRLSCNRSPDQDTNPECLQVARDQMRSITDEEPDSALMRQMDLKASRSGIEVKGPSIMVFAFSAMLAAGVAAWAWIRHLLH